MAIDRSEIQKAAGELREYANLEGSELGEYADALCNLSAVVCSMEPEFAEAYAKELLAQLAWFKANTRIDVVDRTITDVVRELVFLNE